MGSHQGEETKIEYPRPLLSIDTIMDNGESTDRKGIQEGLYQDVK